jgi:IS4 transposase
MDLGYIDYKLFAKWTKAGIFFVTRLRHDLNWLSLQNHRVPQHRNILEDETIRFNSQWGRKYCRNLQFRRIVVDIEGEQPLVLLTNHLNFGVTTIAAIYKDRWQIEVFFKALKQNLKVKSFVGTSPNAIYIQIWTALIALLLLKWLHYLSKAKWSLSNLAAMLRLNLFTYRDLLTWLDQPFSTPPLTPDLNQLSLEFA